MTLTIIEQAIKTANPAAVQDQYELDVYGKRGITLVRGEGSFVWDDTGRAYMDGIAGHGAANLGHAHPALLAAIQNQAGRLISCPGAFHNDTKAAYLEALIQAAPASLKRAFLCNSGAESVEAAIKFARLSTGRGEIIAAKRGFHGRTYAAMSATHNPKYRQGCEPIAPGFTHISFNNTAALEAAVSDTTAAVILEIVQGEGGVRPASAEFLQAARNLCDRHGAMLIIDEVQTGFGRTGALFACEHFNLEPDILCLAKSIAGGLPMGATLVSDRVQVPIGKHGSTFGGNPLACAAGLAVLGEMTRAQLPEAAQTHGSRLAAELAARQYGSVREIRQMGLMIGLELKVKVRPILAAAMEAGLLALPAGATVLRLLPPLTISDEEVDLILSILDAVL